MVPCLDGAHGPGPWYRVIREARARPFAGSTFRAQYVSTGIAAAYRLGGIAGGTGK